MPKILNSFSSNRPSNLIPLPERNSIRAFFVVPPQIPSTTPALKPNLFSFFYSEKTFDDKSETPIVGNKKLKRTRTNGSIFFM